MTEKAKAAKSAEELLASADRSKTKETVKLSDEKLGNVSGGADYVDWTYSIAHDAPPVEIQPHTTEP